MSTRSKGQKDLSRHAARSRGRSALIVTFLVSLLAGLVALSWVSGLIGPGEIKSLQRFCSDLPGIEVLRAREEAEYEEDQVDQREPFVLLLGPGERPPMRPMEMAVRPDRGNVDLQVLDGNREVENGARRNLQPERIKKPVRNANPAAEGPGDDEPLADGPGDDEPLADGPGDDEPLGDGGGAQIAGNNPRGNELNRLGRDFVPVERAGAAQAGNLPAGEDLLDGRWLRMRLQTNFAYPGVLVFSSGGTFLTALPVNPNGRASTPRDPMSGLFNVAVNLDVQWLQAALDDINLLSPGRGILNLDVALHSTITGSRITRGSWSGHVQGLPWLEFSADLPEPLRPVAVAPKLGRKKSPRQAVGLFEAARIRRPQRTRVRLDLHPRSGDSFYFLVGAANRHDLLANPDNEENGFEFLRNVQVLSSGTLNRRNNNLSLFLDSRSNNRSAVPYVALWSYHQDRGWARSRVSLVP